MPYPNSFFPVSYQPNYTNPYQPQFQTPQPPQTPQPVQQPTPTPQNGFVRVQNENEARMYPVAPGNSVTFIDENAPYCYMKSVDLSQLNRPTFEKYRLVKEEDVPSLEPTPIIEYAAKSDLDQVWSEINSIKDRLDAVKKVQATKAKKQEDSDE